MYSRPFLFRAALLSLLLPACARRQPAPPAAPVVETVRTPDSPTPVAAARDLADIMATDLKLTPAQTTQVRQILNTTVTQANTARQQHAAGSAPLTAELKRINAGSQTQLKQVLGPAKYKELLAKQRQLQAQMQQRAK